MIDQDLKILVKDILRGARFGMRQASQLNSGVVGLITQEMSHLADDIASKVDEGLRSFGTPFSPPSSGFRSASRDNYDRLGAAVDAIKDLAAASDEDLFVSGFGEAYYALIKSVLNEAGIQNAFISQQSVREAGRAVWAKEHYHFEPQDFSQSALALIEANPIRNIDPPKQDSADPFIRHPNQSSALAIGLALTVARHYPESNADTCVASAVKAVRAVPELFENTLKQATPEAEMTKLFEEFSQFLP